MDRIPKHSLGVEGICFGGFKIVSLFAGDDTGLLASSDSDLQFSLEQFKIQDKVSFELT